MQAWMALFFSLGLFVAPGLQALEIDDKLTVRLLKSTRSKKTVLLNRGQEDGLKEGDHAKFFLSFGVVARGILIKLSPTRSIWSLYRLVNADYIKEDSVMNIKIAEPVPLTDDRTRVVVMDDERLSLDGDDPRNLGIPLADGADDLAEKITVIQTPEERLEDSGFGQMPSSISHRNIELFALLHLNGQASTVSDESGTIEVSGSSTYMNFTTGAEIYFRNENAWYSRLSLMPMFQFTKKNLLGFNGTGAESTATEFGGGVNLYPFTPPFMAHKILIHATAGFLVGSVSDILIPSSTSSSTREISGSSVGFNIGVGIKYYLENGMGFRMVFDYFAREDSFDPEVTTSGSSTSTTVWDRSNSGPRFMAGLGYRF